LEPICKKSYAIPEDLITKINKLSYEMNTSNDYRYKNFSIKLFLPINLTLSYEPKHDIHFNIDIKYENIIDYIKVISSESFKKIYGDQEIPPSTIAIFSFSYYGKHLMNIYYDFSDTENPIQIERIDPDGGKPINICIDELKNFPNENLKELLVLKGGENEPSPEEYIRTNYSASLIFSFYNNIISKEYDDHALKLSNTSR